jgi:hypothetical protein
MGQSSNANRIEKTLQFIFEGVWWILYIIIYFEFFSRIMFECKIPI